MTLDEIIHFADSNARSVKIKETSKLQLLKYSQKALYRGEWTPELSECRGTIIDRDNNLVTYPFTKIFNEDEPYCPHFEDGESVDAWPKINGFMAAVSVFEGRPLVSTTGSVTGPHVEMAREMLPPESEMMWWFDAIPYPVTFLFEIVHEQDPHIIKHEAGAYYLGHRKNEIGSRIEYMPTLFRNGIVKVISPVMDISMVGARHLAYGTKLEGYVVYTTDGRSCKLKSPYYLSLRFLARSSMERIRAQGKERVDWNYHHLLDEILEMDYNFEVLEEQDRLEFCRAWIANRSKK